MNKLVRICFVFLLTASAACSSGGSGGLEVSGENLSLRVTGSRSFNPDIVHGRIDYYQLKITAPDLNIPFVQKVGGQSASASLVGIPAGSNRTLTVEAFNPNGLVIRRGKKEGLSILPGQVSKAEVVMVSVPIFTNIADRSAVSGNRLVFGVFAEPGSTLQIFEAGGEEPLTDHPAGSTWVDTQNNTEGLFSFNPGALALGSHSFTLRDDETGESSTVALTLYNRTVRPGLGVNSGGVVRSQNDELILSGAGQFYYRPTTNTDTSANATLLDVVELFY